MWNQSHQYGQVESMFKLLTWQQEKEKMVVVSWYAVMNKIEDITLISMWIKCLIMWINWIYSQIVNVETIGKEDVCGVKL